MSINITSCLAIKPYCDIFQPLTNQLFNFCTTWQDSISNVQDYQHFDFNNK